MRVALGKERSDWIDRASGFGIVLVVIRHAIRSIVSSRAFLAPAAFERIDDAIHLFHIPLFFLQSGVVFRGIWPGAAVLGWLGGRARRLLVQMVIWTYGMIGLRVMAGSNANAASTLSDLLIWPLPPFELMWFL
jgi:fucose 4-O-acetylase-like acetyltransferase